ncbi:MAG: M42 family metallopeptidase [Planctomycetes bacterium]|nr:M42 family metallopeptidase [Planctomycetota bacterium]
MESKSLNFLKELVNSPSPSGYEQPTQEIWCKYVRPFVDEIKKDVHGNAIAVINPKGKPRLMFSGHCDEIGLMVRYIDDKGYIYFGAIGGIDTGILPGQRFHIHTKKGPVLGVVGKKAIHLMEEEERKSAGSPKIYSLWLDIGAKNKAEVEKIIDIGDPITFAVGFENLKNDLIVARGFDDKMGAFVVAETLRLISRQRPKAAVFGVSTVQEEIGIRGARTSAYGISPDVGIAIDVTFATDHPDSNPKRIGDIKLGSGPVISRGPNINPMVFEILTNTAKSNKISCQIEAAPGATGTDANAIQMNKSGVAAGLVSVPNRYMHTPIEVIALSDLENTSKLLAAFTLKLTPNISFIP